MTTKEILLDTVDTEGHMGIMLEKIDFSRLDELVTTLLEAFIYNRGLEVVRYDLNYDVATPTDTFIRNLMEIGPVELLKENGLLHDETFIHAIFLLVSAFNIAVATYLREQDITEVKETSYFEEGPIWILIENAIAHVTKAQKTEGYLFDLVSFNLLGPANGSVIY